MSYYRVNLGLFMASLALLAIPFCLTPTSAGEGLLLPGGLRVPEMCLSKRLTGRPCPSCNLGRSIVLTARGDYTAAIARHPGGPLLFAWLVSQTLLRGVLCLIRPSARYRWLDLSVTVSSWFAVSLATLILRM